MKCPTLGFSSDHDIKVVRLHLSLGSTLAWSLLRSLSLTLPRSLPALIWIYIGQPPLPQTRAGRGSRDLELVHFSADSSVMEWKILGL